MAPSISPGKGVNRLDAWMKIAGVPVGMVRCFSGYPLVRLLLLRAGLIEGRALGQVLV
jgi:hypothetical protein